MKRIDRVKEALVTLGSRLSSDQTGYVSPWRLFIIIIASIFVSEIVAMIVVYFLDPISYFLTTLIDAAIMVILICPILYLFSFRPLIQHVESLRQSEQKVDLERVRLQSILDAMPYGIYIVNQQYDIEYINPVMERDFGPVAGQKCYSYLHGQNEVCAWCKNPIVFDGRSTQWEWSSPTTGKNYEAFDTPLANSDGTLSKLKIIHDITERKRSEELVRMLSSVTEQTADTVVVTDCNGVIEYVNPALEQLTGYQKEDVLGQTPRVLKSGLHDGQFYKTLWDAVLNGQVFHGEITNRKKNGDIFHEVKTITPLRNKQGDITHFVATGKDITERRLAEDRLQKAFDVLEMRVQARTQELRIANSELEAEINERLRAEAELQEVNDTLQMQAIELEMQADELKAQKGELLVANEHMRVSEERLGRAQEIAHLGSWELDLVTNKLTWSDEVYHIFGLQPQEFVATYEAFLEAVHPDDRDAVDDAYSSSIRDGRDTYEIEHRVVKRSTGEIRIVHEKCEHFKNEAGKIIRSVGMVHDITIRKKAEEALQRFQLLSEHSRDIILFMRFQDGRILEANAAAVQAYGHSHDELLALSIPDLRGANTNKLTAEQMAQANDRGILFETIHRRRDGSSFPVEVSSQGATIGGVRTLVSIVRDITARKQAEEQLERSNQKLNEILTSIQDDFYVLDRDWNFVYASRLFTEKIGKEPEDFVGNTIWTMFPKHVGTILDENFRAAMETRQVRRFELGGKYTNAWYRMTVFPSADGITVIGTDITEIRQAEEALRGSEAKYRNLFENMSEEVHFWQLVRDEAGHIKTWRLVDANPPTLRTWGRNNIDEIRGKTTDEIFGPGATDHYMPVVQKIMTEGISHSYEDYFLNLDKYFRFTTVPLADYFITTGADITSIKKAEQALRVAHDELDVRVRERTEELAAANLELSNEIAERREVERQLRIQTAAMDAAANGIIITDPKGAMLWTNPAMAQISGYSKDELIGQNTRLFNSGKHETDFYNQMWGTILAGNVWRGETTNRRKDGSLYIEEQTITPVRNEAGQLSHFIAIKQDVTERKLIYAQLEASNQELKTLTDSERQQRFLAEGLVESSVALNMSLELHAVLDRIFEQTRRIIPYLTADIVLIEDHVATVVRQWWTDEYVDARTIFENDGLKIHEFPIWERICTTNSAVMVSDTQLEDQWNTYFGMKWIRSYLGAPLIYNDQIIGIINLISDQANAFQEDMVKTLQAFAAPAAVAIQNARLYENEQQNRKIAEILSAASVALAQTLDTQMVMETILDYVQFVMPLDVAFVVMSEGDERYSIRAVRTGDDDTALRDSLQDQTIDMLSEPIVRSYFTKHESTFIPDSRELSPWNPPLELVSMNSWLGIPLESMGKVLGIVVIAHSTPHTFTGNQIQLAEAVVKQAVVALQNAWLFEQVRSGRERLQQLSRHLVEIQENERKYIARELHDETSQSLTSLKMGLQVIEKEADRRVRLTEQVRNLQALADETLESLHHLAVNLRPASLDHLGLVDALTSLISSTKQRSGLQAHFKIIGSLPMAPLTEEMETSIYRIVQESITNVIRHAQATYVDVILEWQNEKILIVIEDDGVGIDMQKARETGHLGLIGMQERAEMLGGKLLVDSAPQVGTTLVVEIPYANSNTYSR